MSETKRLGRGLEALLGPISRRRRRRSGALQELPVGDHPAQPVSAPVEARRTAVLRTGRLDRNLRSAAADRRAEAPRWLPADRRGAPLAGGPEAGVAEDPRRHQGSRRSHPPDARAGREPAARQSLADRRGDQLPATDRRVPGLPGRSRATGGPGPLYHRQRAPAAQAAARSRPRWWTAAVSRRVMPARCLASPTGPRSPGWPRPRWQQGWSVRDLEAKVRGSAAAAAAKAAGPASSARHRRVEDALRKRLGTDVRVTARRRGRGLISGELLLRG